MEAISTFLYLNLKYNLKILKNINYIIPKLVTKEIMVPMVSKTKLISIHQVYQPNFPLILKPSDIESMPPYI